jgi:anti-sigma regulatory factor (Ser/Thr protein kinase)
MSINEDVPLVCADSERLEQVLGNLVGNALKFTPKNGRVTISARKKDMIVEVRVSDTGVGIAPEHQKNVFDRFYQIGDTLTKSKVGTGLGLAIVKELVQAHGGNIWVESEVGKGSHFIFTLYPSSSENIGSIMLQARLNRIKQGGFLSVLMIKLLEDNISMDASFLTRLMALLRSKIISRQDEIISLPLHGQCIIILPDQLKSQAIAVRKKFEEESTAQSHMVDGKQLAAPIILGPATYPEDGRTAVELLTALNKR